MSDKIIIYILSAAVICLMGCIVAQRVYINMLEQKIACARSEARWTCGECENAEYILRAVE